MYYLLSVLIVCILTSSSKGVDRCEDENAHFVTCGTLCEPTCEFPEKDPNCNPMCVIGCECLPGYVLHESKCIAKEDCSKISNSLEEDCKDPNAEYTTCGSHCPLTCENPVDSGCIDSCFVGCQCKTGYILHSSMCIPLHQCP